MKIALMFDGPQFGGIGKANLDLANEFIKQGHEVNLVMISLDGPRKNQIHASAKCHVIGKRRAFGIIFSVLRFLMTEKPDLMIVSNIMPGMLVQVARILSLSQTKIAVVNHINIFRNLDDRAFPLRKKLILKYLVPFFFTKSVEVISLTTQARDGISNLLRREKVNVRVIYNPIVVAADEIDDFNQEISWWHESGLRILVLGRIDPLKDIPTVLHAITSIKDLDPKVLIAGEGPSRHALEELSARLGIKGRVKFVGFVPNPSLFLEHADILVSASLSEALPLNLAEALTAGVQVVAADCDFGPREILGDSQWGVLVPLQDPVSTANGIRKLHNNPIPMAMLKQRAADFDPGKIVKEFIELVN
ncbi:glycosyltransferase [Marinobacter sp. NSM]|uniref:glycosyltransferase n=1 Tax=Marinobacter sp. NSM TaxID=3458004 RepID=UPI004035A0C2